MAAGVAVFSYCYPAVPISFVSAVASMSSACWCFCFLSGLVVVVPPAASVMPGVGDAIMLVLG